MALKTYILSSLAKVFPDEEPKTYETIEELSAFRNEKTAFQVAFSSDVGIDDLSFSTSENLKIYKVGCVASIKAADEKADDYYLRKASGLYPDVLKPYNGEKFKLPANTWMSFWIEGENLSAGKHKTDVCFSDKDNKTICVKSICFDIIDADLPEQNLICTNWFHCDSLAVYYNVPVFGRRFWKITESFVKTAAEHGINCILTPIFTPPLDTQVGCERLTVQLIGVKKNGDTYEFDFTKLKKWIKMCLKNGIKYFEMAHFFTQWGARHAPKIVAEVDGKEKKIFGWETDSVGEEYRKFLSSLAPKLTDVLEKLGVADNVFFHISDEPSNNDLEVYGKISVLIKELFGKRFKIIDALSDFEFYRKGYVTIPIPNEASIENFVGKVPELWTYYCCGPTDNYYSNRFLSMPLQRTRIIGMQMYKYGVTGFLHWGYNFYFTCLSARAVDPFAETDADCAFSSGDSFIVYPAPDGSALSSIRLKAMNEAFQDMRALQILEKMIGKNEVLKILETQNGESFNLTFSDYPRSEKWHLQKRNEINRKIKEML